jgi:hypothetical protein
MTDVKKEFTMETLPGIKRNLTKFAVDLAIFVGFLLALDPRATGIAVHEWLALAAAAAIVVHLLLSWNWIVGVTRRFFKQTAWRARVNYMLNWLLFIDGVLIMLSGLLISRVVLPAFGIQLGEDRFWRTLHSLSADWSVLILGLHVALHWDWIVSIVKTYMLRPLAGLRLRKTAAATAKAEEVRA